MHEVRAVRLFAPAPVPPELRHRTMMARPMYEAECSCGRIFLSRRVGGDEVVRVRLGRHIRAVGVVEFGREVTA